MNLRYSDNDSGNDAYRLPHCTASYRSLQPLIYGTFAIIHESWPAKSGHSLMWVTRPNQWLFNTEATRGNSQSGFQLGRRSVAVRYFCASCPFPYLSWLTSLNNWQSGNSLKVLCATSLQQTTSVPTNVFVRGLVHTRKHSLLLTPINTSFARGSFRCFSYMFHFLSFSTVSLVWRRNPHRLFPLSIRQRRWIAPRHGICRNTCLLFVIYCWPLLRYSAFFFSLPLY